MASSSTATTNALYTQLSTALQALSKNVSTLNEGMKTVEEVNKNMRTLAVIFGTMYVCMCVWVALWVCSVSVLVCVCAQSLVAQSCAENWESLSVFTRICIWFLQCDACSLSHTHTSKRVHTSTITHNVGTLLLLEWRIGLTKRYLSSVTDSMSDVFYSVVSFLLNGLYSSSRLFVLCIAPWPNNRHHVMVMNVNICIYVRIYTEPKSQTALKVIHSANLLLVDFDHQMAISRFALRIHEIYAAFMHIYAQHSH